MFASAISLTVPPELYIQIMGENGCNQMFFNTGLLTAPTLLAREIPYRGCLRMFDSCSYLTTSCAMPNVAIIGEEGCYGMYVDCSALTTVPKLTATHLGYQCYNEMFNRCTALTVTSASTAAASKAWYIPQSGKCKETESRVMTYMFHECLGVRVTDNPELAGSQVKYYTVNDPV